MEYVDGETLATRLLRGALERREVLELGRDLLHALQAVHGIGIVHRDVKPANIFLKGDPASPHVKVVDFGISKLLEDTGATTRAGDVLGTPSYLAPEQAAGDVNLDARVDIWAMGVVLYEELTGHMPFSADTMLRSGVLPYITASLSATTAVAPTTNSNRTAAAVGPGTILLCVFIIRSPSP